MTSVERKRSTTWILLALVALFTAFGLWFANRADTAREDSIDAAGIPVSKESPSPATPGDHLADIDERSVRVAEATAASNVDLPSSITEPASRKNVADLRGRVLDLSGKPVADQAVHLRASPDTILARSIGDGTFTCEAPPRTGTLVADSAQFTCLRGVQLPAADGAFVIVAPAIAVAGFVVDEHGTGIDGASIEMRESHATFAHFPEPLDRTQPIEAVATKSDGDGRFTYERAAAGVGMKLQASHGEYEDASIDVPDFARADLRIVLTKARALTRTLPGVVVHRDGTAAPRARVRLGDARTETDGNGAFKLALPDMVEARDPLFAIESGHQAAYVADFGKVLNKKWQPDPVRLVLGNEPLSISGRVVDAQGTPQAGWIVRLLDGTRVAAHSGGEAFIEQLTTGDFGKPQTGPDGAFSIGGLLERAYTLLAYHSESLVRLETRPVASGTSHFDIVVPADAVIASLKGRVIAHTGTPIAEALVSIGLVTDSAEGWSTSISGQSMFTKADGTFELTDVPRRFAYLHVGGDHVMPQQFQIETLDATTPIMFTVERRCHFRVEGLPSDGEERFLAIHDSQGKELSIKTFQSGGWMSTDRQTVTTAETRVFAVSEVAAEIVLCFPRNTVVAKRALRLVPGEVTVVKW